MIDCPKRKAKGDRVRLTKQWLALEKTESHTVFLRVEREKL